MVAIYIAARIKKLPAQPFPGIRVLARSGLIAMGGLMLIFIVLGSIYGGVASPTEAAAVATVYAWFIAVVGYRDMGPLKNVPWRKGNEAWGVRGCARCGRYLPVSWGPSPIRRSRRWYWMARVSR